MPRIVPKQKRARETLERILDTASELLDEVGVDGFSTKLLADRAGVLIRSVYRYFPNKQAIVVELARRMAEREGAFLGFFGSVADVGTDWRVALHQTVDAFVAHAVEQPGILAVRRAMRTSPALQEIDDRSSRIAAAMLANALERRGLELPRAKLALISKCTIDLATVLLDRAGLEGGDDPAAYVEELELILESYLATYLEPGGLSVLPAPASDQNEGEEQQA